MVSTFVIAEFMERRRERQRAALSEEQRQLVREK